MNTSEDINKLFSTKTVAKNTIYNLIGYGLPLAVAIILIPPLIHGLGEERFGILSLSWVIIGYFSFLDFGIGRSLTKIIAEKIGLNRTEEIPQIFWTSVFLMLVISIIITLLLLFSTKYLVYHVFNISEDLLEESLYSFYVVALTIPIVTTTAGLRGLLEAYQKFAVINTLRIILGVFTFSAPLLCMLFTKSLFWILLVLSLIRVIIWILYLFQCFRINLSVKERKFVINRKLFKPILSLSGWMTVSNVVGPMIIYLDRFLIGAVISAVAITYYTTPYEIVTKFLLVPGALTGVLFPAFSTSYLNNPDITKKLFSRGVKFIFIFLYPIIIIIITFAYEGMYLWLGITFAQRSTFVLQMLAIGVLLNSLAYIPFTYLQGIGKPKIPALVNLIELPFYCIAMWFAISRWGIEGAAVTWLLRILIDTIILFGFTEKLASSKIFNMPRIYLALVFAFTLVIPIAISDVVLKIFFVAVILTIFSVIVWKIVLLIEERNFLFEKFNIIRMKS